MIVFISDFRNGGSDRSSEVEAGLTLGELLSRFDRAAPEDRFLIRVNRQPVGMDYILRQDDRISITPRNVRGAAPATLAVIEGASSRGPRSRSSMKNRRSERTRMERALEIIDERARSIPREVQAEMLAELQKGLDEERMSPRKFFP